MGDDDNIIMKIIIIILNVFIAIIALFLSFLFLKSKSFNTFPCYNMVIFSLILLFDCIIRLIPTHFLYSIISRIQAFLLCFFDKLILAILTMHTIIFYIGTIHTDAYYNHEKKIFIISFIISGAIGIILTGIYLNEGITRPTNRYYFYVKNSEHKKILDVIFDSVLLVPNFYCNFVLLLYTSRKCIEAKKGLIEDIDYRHKLIRVILLFILNLITFIESYLIIYSIMEGAYVDIVYLLTCLFIDLYNSLNRIVFTETLKVFFKDTYVQKLEKIDSLKILGDENIVDKNGDDDNLERERTESF